MQIGVVVHAFLCTFGPATAQNVSDAFWQNFQDLKTVSQLKLESLSIVRPRLGKGCLEPLLIPSTYANTILLKTTNFGTVIHLGKEKFLYGSVALLTKGAIIFVSLNARSYTLTQSHQFSHSNPSETEGSFGVQRHPTPPRSMERSLKRPSLLPFSACSYHLTRRVTKFGTRSA